MLPHITPIELSEKTSTRIRWQVGCILALFGFSFIPLIVYEWQNSHEEVSPNGRRLRDLTTYTLVGGAPAKRTNLTKQMCMEPTGTAPGYIGTAPCSGMCTGYQEQWDIDELKSQFVMVQTGALEIDRSGLQALAVLKPEKRAWIVWYTFQIIYMFCALAIVCDEFFVPSLECFVEEFGISFDVAGATFMAAGGSMPELATSMIATFKESEVGFAAIVGSAVFNVLFVIAVCAISSKEVLTLTWWPLARDCSFYIIALLTVVWVFADTDVAWYEALILLGEYVGYCTFMCFNESVSKWIEKKIGSRKVAPDDGGGINKEGEDDKGKMNPHFKQPSTFRVGLLQLLTQPAHLYETAGLAAITQYAGDVDETFQMLDKDSDGFLDISEMQEFLNSGELKVEKSKDVVKTLVRKIGGGNTISKAQFENWYKSSEVRIQLQLEDIFHRFDGNKDDRLDGDELRNVLKQMDAKKQISDDEIKAIIEEIKRVSAEVDKEAEEDEVKEMNETSGSMFGSLTKGIKDRVSGVHNGAEKPSEINNGAEPPEGEPKSMADPSAMAQEETDPSRPSVTLPEFEKWYLQSYFYDAKKKAHDMEEAAAEGMLDIDAPEFPMPTGDANEDKKKARLWYSGMFWYILTYPLVCVMWCTIPDVRTPKYQRNWKVATFAFLMSLFWIALFANWLYECIVVVSATIKIPPAVAAVTVLAAGTSIPDLISSYVVARKGEGDMAVSSSIGSNIFDVTVGLPLPWLLYCIAKGKDFTAINSDTLVVDILVLVGMIAAVIGTVMLMSWKMNKCMGFVMLLLYVLFLVQNLLGQMPEGNPTLDYTAIR